ncbi:MAG: hypothetical protein PUE13_08755, partial [Clostridiales bacterium]|nr:hypothetical protein [Clostridiales bacterium]
MRKLFGTIMAVLVVSFLFSCGGSQKGELPTMESGSSDGDKASEIKTDLYSISNKGSGWGFKKNVGAKPDIPREI